MRARQWLAAAALGAAAVSSATAVSAEEIDGVRPALDTRGFVTVDGGEVLGPGKPSFGIVTSWTRGLMSGGGDVVMPTLIAAVGVPWGLELAASLPFAVISADGGQSTQEVGDLALAAKLRIVDREHWAVAVAGGVALPGTGDGRAIVEWRGERLRLGANLGARGRALDGGVAASWALSPGRIDAIGEVGRRDVTVALRARLAISSHFTIGAGAGLDGDVRAFAAIIFEPRTSRMEHTEVVIEDLPPPERPPSDRDDDHIIDRLDGCPDDAEDLDEYQDDDGCPDPDNDDDHIVDTDDLCPDEPGVAAEAGCPERDGIDVTETEIVVLEEINFEFDSDVILEDSYAILEAIAGTLERNPDIEGVEIGGHTDARGKAAYNLDLSQRRADSVRRFLIDAGVDRDRLTASGYGETRPKVRGTGERVWKANRRVDFLITRR
jgi:outer membrane protein OmpA-like peptidoglycan-associated protein